MRNFMEDTGYEKDIIRDAVEEDLADTFLHSHNDVNLMQSGEKLFDFLSTVTQLKDKYEFLESLETHSYNDYITDASYCDELDKQVQDYIKVIEGQMTLAITELRKIVSMRFDQVYGRNIRNDIKKFEKISDDDWKILRDYLKSKGE